MLRSVLSFVLLLATALLAHGFHSPSVSRNTFAPARSVQGAHFHHRSSPLLQQRTSLKMSEEPEEKKAVISADGTFYDDEIDSAPEKEGISDSMRERLMREAATGLDSDTKNTNVLLYIIAGVAVLVALGGAGIFY